MNKYKMTSFLLGDTLNEFFKLDSKEVIVEINKIADSGNKYVTNSSNPACVIKIGNIDYIVATYSMGNELHLVVTEKKKVKTNNILDIKNVSSIDVELDFRYQIQYYIDGLESDKNYDKANEVKELYKEYDTYKTESSANYSNNIKYINSSLNYDLELVKNILKSLNIKSDSILLTMKDEILLKSNLVKNDLIEIFNSLSSDLEFGKKYYYGDADYSLVRLPSDDGRILLGYNNVVSCDEYFMLFEKNDNSYSVIFEYFRNLENKNGYKKLETLNAFENDENIEIVKNLTPIYKSNSEQTIKTDSFSSFAFAINNIAYSLKNEEPC